MSSSQHAVTSPDAGTLIVLVRLRKGADREAYERFAATIDRPGVLEHYASVKDWQLHQVVTTGNASEQPGEIGTGFDYIEIAPVNDVDQLHRDMRSPAAIELVRQALRFIEAPTVFVTRQVELHHLGSAT